MVSKTNKVKKGRTMLKRVKRSLNTRKNKTLKKMEGKLNKRQKRQKRQIKSKRQNNRSKKSSRINLRNKKRNKSMKGGRSSLPFSELLSLPMYAGYNANLAMKNFTGTDNPSVNGNPQTPIDPNPSSQFLSTTLHGGLDHTPVDMKGIFETAYGSS